MSTEKNGWESMRIEMVLSEIQSRERQEEALNVAAHAHLFFFFSRLRTR